MQLRAIEPEDLELLYSIENDISLWWIGAQTAPISRYHLREYIANNENDIYKDEQVRYIIEISQEDFLAGKYGGEGSEEGRLMGEQGKGNIAVGIIDLFNFSPQHNRAEIGIAILKQFQGRGIAQKAIILLAEISKEIIHLNQIYAIVPEKHKTSLNMLEKTGFVYGGTLKKWLFNGEKYSDATIMQLFLKK